MSALSNCLREVIADYYDDRQLHFANATGVSHSIVSRYLSGSIRPDKATLEKIVNHQPPSLRAKIACAHLHDECPESARPYVTIGSSSEASDQGLMIHDRPEQGYIDGRMLDRRTRTAIQFLINHAVDHQEAQDFLVSTAIALGAKLDA